MNFPKRIRKLPSYLENGEYQLSKINLFQIKQTFSHTLRTVTKKREREQTEFSFIKTQFQKRKRNDGNRKKEDRPVRKNLEEIDTKQVIDEEQQLPRRRSIDNLSSLSLSLHQNLQEERKIELREFDNSTFSKCKVEGCTCCSWSFHAQQSPPFL